MLLIEGQQQQPPQQQENIYIISRSGRMNTQKERYILREGRILMKRG